MRNWQPNYEIRVNGKHEVNVMGTDDGHGNLNLYTMEEWAAGDDCASYVTPKGVLLFRGRVVDGASYHRIGR